MNVKIDGQIARTSIDQEFFNPNNQRLEGTYLFPVPKGGQIDKFFMEINGQLLRHHPESQAWFALGRNVQVLIGETVYEVVDQE